MTHQTVMFTMPIGTDGQFDIQNLFLTEKGKCIAISLENSGTVPIEFVNVRIKDNAGTDLVQNLSWKTYVQRQGGNFKDSLLPVNFNDKNISISLISNVALTANFVGQFVFWFENGQVSNTNGSPNNDGISFYDQNYCSKN